MPNLRPWEWLLFGVTAYVAVTSLVWLMRVRRDALIAELSQQAAIAEQAQKDAERKAKREKLRQAAREKTAARAATPARRAA